MAEPTVPAQDSDAPASEPVSLTSAQISELIANGVQSAFDKRIPGLMSTFDSKVNALGSSLEEMRRTSSDDDDDDTAAYNRLQAERDEARRQAAAAKAALQYPVGYQVYEQAIGKGSPEEQIAFLEEWAKQQAGQQTPADPPPSDGPGEEKTPPVDPNNPRREETFGGFQSDEDAERYLDQYGSWPREE